MKCSYHPAVESQGFCSVCSKSLCNDCKHQIKGKVFCQDCLVRGAEWIASVKNLQLPADSTKRAAWCALIPGMGAVYNSEYTKALTFFSVFAALLMMGDRISGVFGLGAFAFYIFTIFEAYRTAKTKALKRLESNETQLMAPEDSPQQDKTVVGWGIFLIIVGVLFLLQNLIPNFFLYRLWPLLFIFLGAYLVYRALQERHDQRRDSTSAESKDF